MVASEALSGGPDSELLFATDIPDNVVKLKNVILNEFHVLRKFSLISLCNEALRVKLKSDLGSQIGFQINNENFDNENNVAEQTVATFLADDFNQLFNTVNLLNEVVLQPRQVQQVILTFRPCEPFKDSARPLMEKDEKSIHQRLNQNGSAEPPKRVNADANQAFHVNGKLNFSATVLRDGAGLVREEPVISKIQDVVVQFTSMVCRSVLRTDVSEIVFEDCIPGGVFVKDLSIWNLSEIPGSFELHVKTGHSEQPVFDLTDYDTGLPIFRGEIKSFSHRRVRVTYKPKDVGDFAYVIHLQNNYDERNSKSLPLRCIVNSEQRQEGLLVTGVGEDGVLDFGKCISGNGSSQKLTLRNVTQEALVVNLSSDHAHGDQVEFHRQTDLDLLSTASKARLKDVVSHDEDGDVSTEGAHTLTLLLDKLLLADVKVFRVGFNFVFYLRKKASVPKASPPKHGCAPTSASILYPTSWAVFVPKGNAVGPSVRLNKKSKVETLSLGRGEEKNLLVWLFPAGASDEAKAARLQRRSFRLSLKCIEKKGYSKQRFSKIVQCKAQVCTSIVQLSVQELNFGDCNVGSSKASSVQIVNLSDVPALITSYVTSTVLSFKSQAERVSIPEHETHSLDIELVPLKINHKYRKQIRVDNLLNKENNQMLEVRAKILDRHHVLFHSIHYKLSTPSMSNSLHFERVVANNPSVKVISVENITEKDLILNFNTTMPGELGVYVLRDDFLSVHGDPVIGEACSLSSDGSEEDFHDSRKRAYAASVNKEKILETLEESQPRLSKAIVDSAPFPVQQGHAKPIPSRSPFPALEQKTRMRMSLDLATSPLSGSLANIQSPESGPIALAANADKKPDDSGADVKPFTDTNQKTSTAIMKRVQSDAMLNMAEEAGKTYASSQQNSCQEDFLEEVLNRLGTPTISDSSYVDEDAMKKYIDDHVRDRELTMHALEDISHPLVPLSKLELPPGELRTLYVVLVVDGQSHADLQGRLQNLEAKITIQMIEYDKERQEHLEPGSFEPAVDEDLSTREIPVEIKVCRALLSLAQKNISFGKMLTNEHRAKTLVLNNVSDVALPYKIKKTGSIASGDLHIIDGRTGVLQPHSSQEVNFVFQPSLGGSFHETLIVSNVYDPSNDQVVTLKATISRAETFFLKSSTIDFGATVSGQWSCPQDFVMWNTSKQTKTFMLKELDVGAEERGSRAGLNPHVVVGGFTPRKLRFMLKLKKLESEMRPEQEAIEALERKALAYERKGKADKVAKVRRQVDELKAKDKGVPENDDDAVSGDVVDLDFEGRMKQTAQDHQSIVGSGELGCWKLEKGVNSIPKGSEGFISFTLKPGDSQVVLVSFFASIPEATPLGVKMKGAFLAYESKNQDVVKRVQFEAIVCSDTTYHEDSLARVLHTHNAEGSPDSLLSLSPTLTPDSSAPPSPGGEQTPQLLSGQSSLREMSASDLFEDIVVNVDSSVDVPSATSRSLSSDFETPLETLSWNSEHFDNIVYSSNVKSLRNQRVESEALVSPPISGTLFKIDLLQYGEISEKQEPTDGATKNPPITTGLTSYAELAQDKTMGVKICPAGEVVLGDDPYGERMEASYLLRSLCSHDIWIRFDLTWQGDAHGLELWVSDLGVKCVGDGGAVVNSYLAGEPSPSGILTDHASRWQPKQLKWQQIRRIHSEGVVSSSLELMTSMCLRGGMAQWVTLRMPDEISQEFMQCVGELNAGIRNVEPLCVFVNEKPTLGRGILTMQAQAIGTPIQLHLRVKPVERILKVAPSDIAFPESDLSTVLTTELSIKNRSRKAVDFETRVSATATTIHSSFKTQDKMPEIITSRNPDRSALSNLTEDTQPSSLADAVVSVSPASGRIKGNGSITAKIVCQPVKSGKQSFTLHIRSSLCLVESRVNITMMPRKVHCLRFLDLPMGSVLDMGYCYINSPEGAKVVPLRLENIFAEPISLSFRSNLTKQVYISMNSTGSPRTDDIHLLGGQTATVYMCLRPGGDASAYKSGHCREIIGGMRFTARSMQAGSSAGGNQEGVIDEIMVKFRAMVGRSLLQVSTSLVDLGRLEEIGGFISGYFVVSNPSNQMPLKFSLSSGRASLSIVEGCLIGREVSQSEGEEKSEMAVEYCLAVTEYGLLEDHVVVQNLSCPGQNAEVRLQVYVDRGSLKAQVEPPLQHFHFVQLEEKNGLSSEDTSFGNTSTKKQDIDSTPHYNTTTTATGFNTVNQAGHSSMENISALELSRESGTKASSFGQPWPAKRTLSLPAVNMALESFYEKSVMSMEQNAGPLQDRGYLDLGTVFVSHYTSEIELEIKPVGKRETKGPSDYVISDLRPYHSSLLLTNLSDEAMTLQPVSTLPVLVDVTKLSTEGISEQLLPVQPVSNLYEGQGFQDSDFKSGDLCYTISRDNSSGSTEATESPIGWTPCGNAFSLQPGCTIRLYVACQGTRPLYTEDLSRLSRGTLCAFEGLLAFYRTCSLDDKEVEASESSRHVSGEWAGSHFLELLTIKGSICVSAAEVVVKDINLGKIGDANGWNDLEFEIDVHNRSDADLIYDIVDIPEVFVFPVQSLQEVSAVTGHATRCLAARRTGSIQAILHTSKLEKMKQARTWSWRFHLTNRNNPKNVIEVAVVAEMTVRNLQFGGLIESVLLLPPLTVPAQSYAPPCMTEFTVENLSAESLGVALELHQVEDTESLVTLEITSKTSNTTIVELTMQPGEKAALRVGAQLVSDFIPRTVRRHDGERPSNEFMSKPGSSVDNATPLADPFLKGTGPATTEPPWHIIPHDIIPNSSRSQGVNGKDLNDEDVTASIEENIFEAAGTVCLGKLYLFSSPVPDCILIYGTLIEGPMFNTSPDYLQFQAKLLEKEDAKYADDAESVANMLQADPNLKVEKNYKIVRMPSWEGWHAKSSSFQRIVVENYLSFEHLQFKVWAEETLTDGFGSPLQYLEVHPQESSVPPNGTFDVVVRSLPWCNKMHEAFLKQVSDPSSLSEFLTTSIFLEDVEKRDSRQRIEVRIAPPLILQKSLPEEKSFEIQMQNSLGSKLSDCSSKELQEAANHLKQHLPVLGLRGCTPVNGSPVCYEFNLGQQNISSGGHRHWKLTLVGAQWCPISYRLCTISGGDAGWLSISSPSGIVEAAQQNTVRLSFSTKAMGVFSTYLVVENLDNPADFKTVHLCMEVVALKNARPEAPAVSFFHVLVQGSRAEGAAVDMAEIYYNFWYRNRSFVVVNEASVAMEFLLSSTLDHNDSTELNFSLENTSLKRFSSVTVDANCSIRLWIHFCIGPPTEKPLTEHTCDELAETIFVNCRLVKDYQRCIPFRAKCRYPQIGISSTDIVFSTRRHGTPYTSSEGRQNYLTTASESGDTEGLVNAPFIENEVLLGFTGIQRLGQCPAGLAPTMLDRRDEVAGDLDSYSDTPSMLLQPGLAPKSRREDDLDLIPFSQTLIIRNLYSHRKLEYVVKNDSLFFEVDLPKEQGIAGVSEVVLPPSIQSPALRMHDKACQKIVVRPNLGTLREHQQMIMKQKYVEEHLTVYNRSNPLEKYTVSLRITAGHLRNFFAAPGPKNSYSFERLELNITCFLSTFYSLMSRLLTDFQHTSGLRQRLDPQTAAITGESKGVRSRSSREAGLGPGQLVKQSNWSMQNQDMFQELEKCLDSFLMQGEGLQDHDSLYFDLQYLTDELVFYSLKERWSKGGATLELSTVQLAKLLYCALYRCQIFQHCLDSCQAFALSEENREGDMDSRMTWNSERSGPEISGQGRIKSDIKVPVPPRNCLKFVEDWTGQLRHFLSFFPDTHDDISSLRELNQTLQEVIVSCRGLLKRHRVEKSLVGM